MKRSIVTILAFSTVCASTAAIYYYQETLSLRQQLTQVVPAENPETSDEQADESAEGTSREGEAANAPFAIAQAAPEPPVQDRRVDRRAERSEQFSRMMSDPAMRDVMLSRIKGRIDEEYNALFVRLGLDEEQSEALRTFIGQRRMAYMQAGFLERNSEGDPEAIAGIEAWRDRELAATAAGIESVLGPGGMDVLTDYREGQSEREFVESISRQASYSGEAIDPQTSEQLVDVVRTAKRTAPLSSNPFERTENGPPPPLTEKSMVQYLNERKAQDQAVLAQARAILTPAQLEALADRQIEQFQREQSQLDFQLRNPDMNQGRGGFGGGRGP